MITKRDIEKLESELNSWLTTVIDEARVEVNYMDYTNSWLVNLLYDLSIAEKDDRTVVIYGDDLKMFLTAVISDLKEYLNNKEKEGGEREEDTIEYSLKEKEARIKINIWDDQYQYYTSQIFNIKLLP